MNAEFLECNGNTENNRFPVLFLKLLHVPIPDSLVDKPIH